jgi:anti-sigma regulatory factor (Ser/Thr protein kinase)
MLAAADAVEARRFAITPEAIADMDQWIEGTGERWGIGGRVLFRARVCAAELSTNVLEHGRVAPGSIMDLELRDTPSGFEIVLSAPGVPFDPVSAPAIEPSIDRIGGRGLRLVRSYARTFQYRRDLDRNVITVSIAPPSG